jgi:hypothetical protein
MTFYNEYSVDSKVIPEEHVPETLLHVHRLTRLSDIGNDQATPQIPASWILWDIIACVSVQDYGQHLILCVFQLCLDPVLVSSILLCSLESVSV